MKVRELSVEMLAATAAIYGEDYRPFHTFYNFIRGGTNLTYDTAVDDTVQGSRAKLQVLWSFKSNVCMNQNITVIARAYLQKCIKNKTCNTPTEGLYL